MESVSSIRLACRRDANALRIAVHARVPATRPNADRCALSMPKPKAYEHKGERESVKVYSCEDQSCLRRGKINGYKSRKYAKFLRLCLD